MSKRTMQRKRDRTMARAWMVEQHLSQREIQVALGQRSSVQISETLRGLRSDRAVLRYLLHRGCPSGYLALPSDMAEAES